MVLVAVDELRKSPRGWDLKLKLMVPEEIRKRAVDALADKFRDYYFSSGPRGVDVLVSFGITEPWEDETVHEVVETVVAELSLFIDEMGGFGVFEEYDFGEYLYERDHWIVFLAPNQSNLGTCVVALKRNEKFLGNLRKDEWDEMLLIISELENAVKREFGATMFNWGVLLNSFYRDNTPPPHLHWHFIPRYRGKVTVKGETFDDPFFGYMRPRPPKRISGETLLEIGSRILRWIKI